MLYFNLLANQIYLSNYGEPKDCWRSQTIFGVLNFSMAGDAAILLPPTCFSVLLDCGTILPGNVQPTDSVKIMPTRTAPIFKLKCWDITSKEQISTDKNTMIPVTQLKNHGMQLVTLYL